MKSTNPAQELSQDSQQCPAEQTDDHPGDAIKEGSTFTVVVSYTGRPGVHNDGDGTTEGWFRSPDGGFVTTEPVASEDWMPLNDYPTAKPTYDFYDTVNAGKTVLCNSVLLLTRRNAPNAEFPHGWSHLTGARPHRSRVISSFPGGRIDLDTLYHENMHQWWGDNVTVGGHEMTFYKEGFATLGEYLFAARTAEAAAGGPRTASGDAAFERALMKIFDETYASGGKFWAGAPSNPMPFTLFDGDSTYSRPGIAYIVLRQILDATNFTHAMHQLQDEYGGSSITEPQLEAALHRWMPNQSAACSARLTQFFGEWFDTAYTSGGADKPQITGPGLSGPGFYGAAGGCA